MIWTLRRHIGNCECWDCICGNASVGVGAGGSAFGLIRLGESREDNTGRGWAEGLGPPPAPRCWELQGLLLMRTRHLSGSFPDFTVKSADARVFTCVCLFLQPRTDAEGHPETPNRLASVAKKLKTSWHDWSEHQSETTGCYSGRRRRGKNQSGANLEKPTQEHNGNNSLAPQKRN